MYKILLLLLLGVGLVPCVSQTSHAAGELHLNFHMGGAVSGQSFVGGTLKNTGDAPVAHGYVVVTVLNAQCHPVNSVLESFGHIAAGESLGFRVPVSELKRYRLAAIKAFDAQGFEVLAVDDNAELLKSREPEEREACALAKTAMTP